MKYLTIQEEMHMLSQQLLQLTENSRIPQDMQFFLGNVTSNVTNVKLPSVYNFLPHLLNDPNSLRPGFILSKGRTDANIVLGIPTVKREVQSYLLATLKNLLERSNPQEITEIVIVVMIAEVGL